MEWRNCNVREQNKSASMYVAIQRGSHKAASWGMGSKFVSQPGFASWIINEQDRTRQCGLRILNTIVNSYQSACLFKTVTI